MQMGCGILTYYAVLIHIILGGLIFIVLNVLYFIFLNPKCKIKINKIKTELDPRINSVRYISLLIYIFIVIIFNNLFDIIQLNSPL